MMDFFAYRLNDIEMWNEFLTLPIFDVAKRLDEQRKVSNIEGVAATDTRDTLKTELDIAKSLFEALGWHGTVKGSVRCFGIPSLDAWRIGYALQEMTSGVLYIASPVPLTHLNDIVDSDGRISTKQIRDMKQRLTGATDAVTLDVGPWRRSVKGNLYTQINGAHVTIFPADHGGMKAIVSSPTGMKVYTKACANEAECAKYVQDNFHELTRTWSGGTGINAPDADEENDNANAWGAIRF